MRSSGKFTTFPTSTNLKTAGRIVKRTKNGPRGRHLMLAGYVSLLHVSVQGHSEVICCVSDYQQPCISKTVGRRGKWGKIWDSRTLVRQIWGTFDVVGFS